MPKRKSDRDFVTKREFCDRIYDKGAFDRKGDVDRFFDSFCECLHELLMNSEQLYLPGVGSFTVEKRPARSAKNPRTGEKLYIPEGNYIKFTQNTKLKGQFRKEWEKAGGGVRVIPEGMPFPKDGEWFFDE